MGLSRSKCADDQRRTLVDSEISPYTDEGDAPTGELEVAPAVLVVDDDEFAATALAELLEAQGLIAEVAYDIDGALDCLRRHRYRLVVLDIVLEEGSGLDVLRSMRHEGLNARTPVMMVSACQEAERVIESLEWGADDYVSKPYDLRVLLARMRALMRRPAEPLPPQLSPAPSGGHIGPGTVLDGRYRIEAEIGTGSFGHVYRAWHFALESNVAVKIGRMDRVWGEDAVARFRREARMALQVRHPNAVRVLDFDVAPTGQPYLVMELLHGSSLGEILAQRERIPPEETLEILAPVCSVLTAMHADGIVHRDIKPENIFLHRDPSGRRVVKVLDFGIAKQPDVRQSAFHTADDRVTGTPQYMSPERLMARPCDGRADVYSLAVVLFEMLVGAFPFHYRDDAPMAMALVHLTGAPRALRDVDPLQPAVLENLIRDSLSRAAEDRPSVVQFAAVLQRAVEDMTGPTLETAPVGPSGPQMRPLATAAARSSSKREFPAHDTDIRPVARVALARAVGIELSGMESFVLSRLDGSVTVEELRDLGLGLSDEQIGHIVRDAWRVGLLELIRRPGGQRGGAGSR